VLEFYVASEDDALMLLPVDGGPRQVPGGRLHAVRRGGAFAECGRPVDELHAWPDIEWISGHGSAWCNGCLTRTHQTRTSRNLSTPG
jgi:hypothetical protein